MKEINVTVTPEGCVVMEGPTVSPLDPIMARTLARMLLTAAEGAQSIRSRRVDGMPERVTTEEMRGFK